MARKVTACGFLYVAPTNLDFSQPSHSQKRWQRRWFSLFDDGELAVALDSNPETVPQLKMDMNRCIRVCEADPITGHAHSILIAFKNDRVDAYESVGVEHSLPAAATSANAPPAGHQSHPVVCYVKADSTEEIRWWQSVLQVYAKQNAIHVTPTMPRARICSGTEISDSPSPTFDNTLVQVHEQRDSCCSSRSSSVERTANKGSDMGSSRQSLVDLHGTPRSVKQRVRLTRYVDTRRNARS
ncbi:Protein F10G8.8 a [Aphelenchoides avenae]|nr:Protein F10G8.8 a [Aphelenchus avenae]